MSLELLLVDDNDNPKGYGEKLDVHRNGQLHRAFSVFIYDDEGKILIQKRADGKYHSGGVWSNSCCSHQYGDEVFFGAVRRCIGDELGLVLNKEEKLVEAGTFMYYASLGEMIEHEIDHVVTVRITEERKKDIKADPEEIEDLRWLSREEIDAELKTGEPKYSAWFKSAYSLACDEIK